MGKYFGTDGFRAMVGEGLLASDAYKIGRFLGQGGKKVLIGADTRRSSPMLLCALSSGVCASGGQAYIVGVVTTPCVCFLTESEGFDYGVMISASHNPFYDNGIKIFDCHAEKLSEEKEREIEEYLDTPRAFFMHMCGDGVGEVINSEHLVKKYRAHLSLCADDDFSTLKIGLDTANGSTYLLAKEIFESRGARVYQINGEPNGVNINCGCGSTHIEALQKFVLENGLDLGFAYDGDGDRCIGVSSGGEVINGDKILYILSKELGAGRVVSTVMSNGALDIALDSLGAHLVRTKVGDRFVYEEMKKGGYPLGGEESGHIIVSKYSKTGDGILTSLLLCKAVVSSKKGLFELSSPFAPFPQIVKSVHVLDKKKIISAPSLKKEVARIEKTLGGGRIYVRASGTENVIRILVEAKSEPLCKEALSLLCDLVEVLDKT